MRVTEQLFDLERRYNALLSVEGATHSAVRPAENMGMTREEMVHVSLLGVTTPGFPASMGALLLDQRQ